MSSSSGPGDRVAAAVRNLPAGVSADARVVREVWTTIRFANGRITQPHFESALRVSFRTAEDQRIATATTADLTPEGVAAVAATSRALARVAPREAKFRGFPTDSAPRPAKVAFSRATSALGPEGATRIAERILAAAAGAAPGARIAGAVNVGTESWRVVNSEGLDRSTASSVAQASVLVDRPEKEPPVSGWAEAAHWDAARIDADGLGREAAERMARSAPVAVRPGAYRVVLRGPAVSELLQFLSVLGFGGLAEDQGYSCLRRQRGRRIAPSAVRLVDDPRSREGLPCAIDYEGVATRATPLIDRGIAGLPATDSILGPRLGRRPSGHALPPESPVGEVGPIPTHLLLAPGDASEQELVRSTKRGLLVTRFHYVRTVDPGRAILTGMTRDGTYRIERGEIAGPARNLRFTESILAALKGIELLGRTRSRHASERGGIAATCPAVLTRSFRFTSATLF